MNQVGNTRGWREGCEINSNAAQKGNYQHKPRYQDRGKEGLYFARSTPFIQANPHPYPATLLDPWAAIMVRLDDGPGWLPAGGLTPFPKITQYRGIGIKDSWLGAISRADWQLDNSLGA